MAFQNEYLSGRALDRFFHKLKAAKMEEERKAGGEETWKFTFSPQPQPTTDPENVIKDEEIVIKMEAADINMEDVEEATEKTMRDEDFCEGRGAQRDLVWNEHSRLVHRGHDSHFEFDGRH